MGDWTSTLTHGELAFTKPGGVTLRFHVGEAGPDSGGILRMEPAPSSTAPTNNAGVSPLSVVSVFKVKNLQVSPSSSWHFRCGSDG